MGKSKAQRKQEKKTAMQEVKKDQELKASEKASKTSDGDAKVETKSNEAKDKKEDKKTETIKHVGPEQVKLTMYTFISMIVTFISAGVTAVAMVVYAKPVIYVLETTVGSTFNAYSLEAVEQLMFEDNPNLPIYGLYLGVGILVAIGALATLIGMIKAVNEFNKPSMAVAVIGTVFAVAALALFIYADYFTKGEIRKYHFEEQPMFNIYSLYLPFLITNVAAMVVNIFTTSTGLKRWKKTGRTSK